jgi:hypothetical protein
MSKWLTSFFEHLIDGWIIILLPTILCLLTMSIALLLYGLGIR